MKRLCRATRPARDGRWLGFELLERRDLLAVIRLVNWNTANGPNDAAADVNVRTVLEAIGNETVQGNTKRVDLLALQETDPNGPGGNSIGRVESILDMLYPSTDYASFASSEDGGGDSTGFVYDTSTLTLLGTPVQVAGALTHSILRGLFRPAGTSGGDDFYVYTIHLKSGDSGSDVTQRGSEAAVLRADADSLGEGANVLFVGDFNMKTSTEPAYATFLSAGAGQLHDVYGVEGAGSWIDNPAFKKLHSQDPRTAMDDRFDIQFASGELFNGVGLEYVANSYHVFGNDGTHTLNMPITTGTGASPAVLSALAVASDHLPVVADYEIIVSTPNVRITETGGGTKVIEGGLYDTYYAVLDTMPEANVTVTVSPNVQLDTGAGAGGAQMLTFTPANWQTPQVVVVRAVDDATGEGNHTGIITHSSTSADVNYNGLTIVGITVKIIDNDAPTIVINELDSDQVGTDMAEFVELYDGGVGNASLSGMTLVFFNGATDTAYRVVSLNGMTTNGDGFFLVGNVGVSGVDIAFPNNTLQNGPDAVALYAGTFVNGAAVTTANLLDAVVYKNGGADAAGLQVLLQDAMQPQVNENQNSLGTTQAIARVPDAGQPRVTTTYIAQAPTPKSLNRPLTPGVLIVQSGARVDVAEGGATDSYQIALLTIPTANVTITVDPDSQTDLGAGAGVPIVLTFTPANALMPQLVTVVAVDDALVEGTHASVITHVVASSDALYNGLAVGNVVASVLDNDFAAPPVVVISEIMYNPATNEGGAHLPEWIEVVNAGASEVDMGGWLFDDEDATNWGPIPLGTILQPGQIAVFFDKDFTSAATFRSEWNVPDSALVVGIKWGSLANDQTGLGDEVLKLLDSSGVQRDVVDYDDTNPWPTDNNASSIYLKGLALDNNDGANWARSALGVARAVSPSGAAFSASDIGSPGVFFLPGDYDLSGFVDASDYVLWRKTLGSTMDLRADGSGATVGTPNGIVDDADHAFWRANFGNVGAYYSNAESASGANMGVTAVAWQAPVTVALMAQAPDVSQEAQQSSTSPNDHQVVIETVAIEGPVRPLMMNFLSELVAARPSPPVQLLSGASQVPIGTTVDLLLSIDRQFEALATRDVDAMEAALPYDDAAHADEAFAALEAEAYCGVAMGNAGLRAAIRCGSR